MRAVLLTVPFVALPVLSAFQAPQSGIAQPLLAEVLFDPRPGEIPFVEILNAGTLPADISKMALEIGGTTQLLARVERPLAPGARLVIRFDGQGRAEPGILHSTKNVTLPAESGEIVLRSSDNGMLDRVAWGRASGAVVPGAGGLTRFSDVQRTRGRSIGRAPGANIPDMRSEWTYNAPGAATPGAANPQPPVAGLMPIDGAELSGAAVDLEWYPEPGAVRYRLQVATESTFASPVVDVIVDEPGTTTSPLRPARYVWRVQAIASDGTRAVFSGAATFDLLSSTETDNDEQQGRLAVPYLTQHKDSPLLQLENPRYKEAHGWDADHKVRWRNDKSDSKNCVLANAAMLNHFFKGDLTQDRIGYEVLSDAVDRLASVMASGNHQPFLAVPELRDMLREVRPGPEWDFPYGVGLNTMQTSAALLFALGVEPIFRPDYDAAKEELWRDIVSDIDALRPVVAAGLTHTITITGYSAGAGRRRISINDPARSQYSVDFDVWAGRPVNISTWRIPAGARGRRLEASATIDTDGDGIMDFDETMRFKTDPRSTDTDRDGVPDKLDIVSGVFEREFRLGYAFGPSPTGDSGRDYDQDGLPTERDPDSDDGGCLDGEEDLDKDGFRTGNERSNFSPADEACGRINGTMTFNSSHTMTLGAQISTEDLHVTVSVRLKPDPSNPDVFVDDGSRFAVRSINTITINNPGCTIRGRVIARGSGPFKDPEHIGGAISSDGLTIGATEDFTGTAVTDSCVDSGAAEANASFALRECLGKLTGRRVDGVYLFSCHDVPRPANGVVIHRSALDGRVKLLR